ncbi:hypothetical protein Micbo1qcDRAFT_179071 [Microdochium bolleyi]|uniref:Uncharacterized protein n=1 Tax=Microdochium bolleyi TaxID=196109 RepID=A0A136IRN2_9PEZI|nr:hypothetical protein Micbo1qcDRAFT_179071 [Microdochium bolleyi]
MPNSRRSAQSSISSPRQGPARPSRRPADVERNDTVSESIAFSRVPVKRGLFEFSWRSGADDRKVLLRWEEKGAVKATKLFHAIITNLKLYDNDQGWRDELAEQEKVWMETLTELADQALAILHSLDNLALSWLMWGGNRIALAGARDSLEKAVLRHYNDGITDFWCEVQHFLQLEVSGPEQDSSAGGDLIALGPDPQQAPGSAVSPGSRSQQPVPQAAVPDGKFDLDKVKRRLARAAALSPEKSHELVKLVKKALKDLESDLEKDESRSTKVHKDVSKHGVSASSYVISIGQLIVAIIVFFAVRR